MLPQHFQNNSWLRYSQAVLLRLSRILQLCSQHVSKPELCFLQHPVPFNSSPISWYFPRMKYYYFSPSLNSSLHKDKLKKFLPVKGLLILIDLILFSYWHVHIQNHALFSSSIIPGCSQKTDTVTPPVILLTIPCMIPKHPMMITDSFQVLKTSWARTSLITT